MSSLGPILPGRMPNSLEVSRLLERIQTGNTEIQRLQDQAATGQRIFIPSEDPAAAIRTITLQSTIERRTQLRTNVGSARSQLQLSESALASVNEGLNRAKSLILTGTGDQVTDAERAAVAEELSGVIDGILNASNQKFGDRYLFGGSISDGTPFERLSGDRVRYNGDARELATRVNVDFELAFNVNGAEAFGGFNTVTGSDLNAALTLDTKITDLEGGLGVTLGSIQIVANDGTNPAQTATVDLSNAKTIRDIKTVIENAFAGGPPTVTVDVDPATNNGIRIQQSGGGAGTLTVSDLTGSRVAADLGIVGTGATINGSDLNPELTLGSTLASLNAGTGIGATVGNGLRITAGSTTTTLDISTATTVEDLFNLIEGTGLDIETGINAAGNGLAISSRRAGESFSIGENNGANATNLGIRTLTGATTLAELNLGVGVPNQAKDSSGNLLPANVVIQRRDGTTSTVNVADFTTVQQVIDAITAVDANITASLNTVGNGISITDVSGAGALTVNAGPVADALGIAGTQTPAGALVGSDVNQRTSNGLFDVLTRAEAALRSDDRASLVRLDEQLEAVVGRFTTVRADVGSRLRTLENLDGRLLEEDTALQQQLSDVFDADLAEVITRVTALQSALQATLQIAASSQSLSILAFL